MSPHARMLLRRLAAIAGSPASTEPRVLLQRAHRATHPDLGGDPALSKQVNAIEDQLRALRIVR